MSGFLHTPPGEQVKGLSGNAMSLPAFSAFMMFIFSHCKPVDPAPRSIPAQVQWPSGACATGSGLSGSPKEEGSDSDHGASLVCNSSSQHVAANATAPESGVPAAGVDESGLRETLMIQDERSMYQKGSSASFT